MILSAVKLVPLEGEVFHFVSNYLDKERQTKINAFHTRADADRALIDDVLVRFIKNQRKEDHKDYFYDVWTLKESYINTRFFFRQGVGSYGSLILNKINMLT